MSCINCRLDPSIKTLPTGCKNNGGCSTLSCDKLSVFNWLGNMKLPGTQPTFDIYEVRFKNGRKAYFRNANKLPLSMGEAIAVEGSPGHDIGTISLAGELVKVQLQKRKLALDSDNIKNIYRKATKKDIGIWQKVRNKEKDTQRKARLIIERLGLKMKLSDVEFQGDGRKATFYYTAASRIDFRQLIRELAAAFQIRIEMKQVDLRHEAGRLGGIGSCGRELCCSTWLTDFKKVNANAARYQQLSLSSQHLQGQCGKLKCCLNYELDSYLDALKDFPDVEKPLKTEKGIARFIKMDIFKRLMWYAYDTNDNYKWYCLTVDQVNEIIRYNEQNKAANALEDLEIAESHKKVSFEDAAGEASLTRFDRPKRNKASGRGKKRRAQRNKNTPRSKNTNNPVRHRNSPTNKKKESRHLKPKPNNRSNA